MSEARFWSYLRKGMKPYWYAFRVENNVGKGTPDLWYSLPLSKVSRPTGGWIELKYVEKYQKKLKIKHFTPAQKNFLKAIDQHATAFIFIKIEKDYYLFRGCKSRLIEGRSKLQLKRLSQVVWYGSIDFIELDLILRKDVL